MGGRGAGGGGPARARRGRAAAGAAAGLLAALGALAALLQRGGGPGAAALGAPRGGRRGGGGGGPEAAAAAAFGALVRECGSPAADAYVSADPGCLGRSGTARAYRRVREGAAGRLEWALWQEERADYDGLAVRWGVGWKQESARACAEACLAHEPGSVPGPFEDLPCAIPPRHSPVPSVRASAPAPRLDCFLRQRKVRAILMLKLRAILMPRGAAR